MMAQHESDSIIMFSWLTRNKPNYDLLITIIIRDDEREREEKNAGRKKLVQINGSTPNQQEMRKMSEWKQKK